MSREHSASISPTAHYTSWVWYRNGLSHRALVTPTGRLLHLALRPMNWISERFSARPSLDMMLLARHQLIDHLLRERIEAGRVSQVLEIASGFSARGVRFARTYAQRGLVYVEADLPDSAAAKRRALSEAGLLADNHQVVSIDALSDHGPESVRAVAARCFRPDRGLIILTEGLLGYFDQASVEGMWRRFADTLRDFEHGEHLSELSIGVDVNDLRATRAFKRMLGLFTRGEVYVHYQTPEQVIEALTRAGFEQVELLRPHDYASVLNFEGKERPQLLRVLIARAGGRGERS